MITKTRLILTGWLLLLAIPAMAALPADVDGEPRTLATVGSIDNIPSLTHEDIANICQLAIKNGAGTTRTWENRHVVAIPYHVRHESTSAVVAVLESREGGGVPDHPAVAVLDP